MTEQFQQVAAFVRFFDYTLQLTVAEHLVTGNIDFMHLHLRMFVNVDIDNHLIFMRQILLKPDFDIGVAKTLFIEIFLGNIGGTVYDILGNLVTLHQLQTLLQILALTFLHSRIFHFRNTRLGAQVD